jgi:large subunit ribosomal protein L6
MSRIGKKAIEVPSGVKVEQSGQKLKVTGKLGTLELNCDPKVKVKVEANQISVINDNADDRQANQMHGTTRALINNMVTGVSKGFVRQMEIFGTGYNIKEQGGKVVLSIGFCHPIELPVPKGVKVSIEVPATRGNEVPAKFSLSGSDKCVLGQFASEIRKVRPPEPYKGKGIRYADEHVIRKVGKAFSSGAS